MTDATAAIRRTQKGAPMDSGASHAGERGVALVALVAAMTIGLIYLMTILPSLSYMAKNEREKELIFRGAQIAEAIGRFQQKFGAPPPSIEALVKQKCLRKEFKDPMDPESDWRIIRMGEPVVCVCALKGRGTPLTSSLPTPRLPQALPGRTGIGPIVGVASRSKEKSIRKFNDCDTYSDWVFTVNCQRSLSYAPPLAPGPYAPGVGSGEPIASLMPLTPGGPQPPRPQGPQPVQPKPLLPSRP